MEITKTTVRNATPEDTASLVAFQQAMARETEGKTLHLEPLRRGINAVFHSPDKGLYLVAEAEGVVIGGLLITYEWSDWRNAYFWWIQSVYVAPTARRRGVYRALHQFVVDAARSSGACGVRLYVEKQNRGAQSTYETLGMHETHYRMLEVEF